MAKAIKIRRLTVENFKALDSLDIEFPPPRMRSDPDIFVMGSRNGLGKTSVLESCALLYLAAGAGTDLLNHPRFLEMPVDLNDLLIRAGASHCSVAGVFSFENASKKENRVELKFHRAGKIEVTGDTKPFRALLKNSMFSPSDLMEKFMLSILAVSAEPLMLPHFMYFHSYRKVQEGNPELGMMVESERVYRRRRLRSSFDLPISTFKLEILRSMMSQADLFERFHDEEAGDTLTQLNNLVKSYAGGTIEKLRPSPDNTVDFRVASVEQGASFTFDGLSSGQKEIISTLFLLWKNMRKSPGVVLIDEPELHLNVEWQRDFIQQIQKLAPHNQYIIATHSEDIFGSVEEDRRLLLTAPGAAK